MSDILITIGMSITSHCLILLLGLAVGLKAGRTAAADALTAVQEENERLVHDIERLSASLSAEVTENERLREAFKNLKAKWFVSDLQSEDFNHG